MSAISFDVESSFMLRRKKTYKFSGTHVTFRVWSLSELWKSSVEIICQTFSFVISDDSLQIGVRTVRENVCKLLITLLQNQGQLSVPSVVEETLLTHWRLLISKMELFFSAISKINMTLQVLLKNLENTFNFMHAVVISMRLIYLWNFFYEAFSWERCFGQFLFTMEMIYKLIIAYSHRSW